MTATVHVKTLAKNYPFFDCIIICDHVQFIAYDNGENFRCVSVQKCVCADNLSAQLFLHSTRCMDSESLCKPVAYQLVL